MVLLPLPDEEDAEPPKIMVFFVRDEEMLPGAARDVEIEVLGLHDFSAEDSLCGGLFVFSRRPPQIDAPLRKTRRA